MTVSGIYAWINLAEAALWIGMALGALAFVIRGRQTPASFAASRAGMVLLVIALAAFGASDLVETRTGAWWRPRWLLAWKGGCVIVLGGYVAAWLAARRARLARRDSRLS